MKSGLYSEGIKQKAVCFYSILIERDKKHRMLPFNGMELMFLCYANNN